MKESCVRQGKDRDITMDRAIKYSLNDMHIMEAIGMGEPRKMSVTAHKLSVTVGILTTNVNGLFGTGSVGG